MAKKPIVINETTGQSEKQQLAIGDLSDATTIGQNVVKLANPGAITFPRFNADNTVDALSVVDFRTAIGAPAAFSFTLNGTAAATYTLPATSATLARIDAANTFVGNQSFTNRILVDDATDATTALDGSLQTDGGLSVVKSIFLGGPKLTLNTTANNGNAAIYMIAPSTKSCSFYLKADGSNGARVEHLASNLGAYFWNTTNGEMGFATNNIQYLTIAATGVVSVASGATSTTSATGALVVAGGVGIGGALRIGSTLASTTTTKGSATFAGDIGVAGQVTANVVSSVANMVIGTSFVANARSTINTTGDGYQLKVARVGNALGSCLLGSFGDRDSTNTYDIFQVGNGANQH